jgi:uncharacterized SAM-binding protein YcdF (DUF218 family)
VHRGYSECDGDRANRARTSLESVILLPTHFLSPGTKPALLKWRKFRLVQRRTVWCPTWLGLFCITILLLSPAAWWFCWGESFLSQTKRLPAEVLVVEGWIGPDGVDAAAAEFEQHGYQYIVSTGGLTTGEGWSKAGWSYAEGAASELIRFGIPKDKIVVAPARNTESHRTYECAAAVRHALQSRGIHTKNLNVFTLGPHARRSRLVFAKVYEAGTQVGVIGWAPSGDKNVPWWKSSTRAKEMVAETAGYLYEALFNSGRTPCFPQRL